MVTTVFPENRGFVIEKPESKLSEQLKLKKITFTVSETGQVQFKNSIISIGDIERLVKEQLTAAPDTGVMLQVDKRATRVAIATKPSAASANTSSPAVASKP